jgi:hypothetical protein
MRRYLPLTIGIAAALLADPVLALDLKPLEASSVKAALDCVAAAALNDLPANSRLFFDATPFGPFTKCGSDYVAPPHATLASRRLAMPYLGRTCTG